MNTYPKCILIVSHTFPPAPGIGGRRWAKHAKYLQGMGIHTVVLSAQLSKEGSLWTQDIADVERHTYPRRFPEILSKVPGSFSAKVAYRSALAFNKLLGRGTPYDRALYDRNAYLHELEVLAKKIKPEAIIVTGAPFRLPWYTLSIKALFPNSLFVADFRDPWTDGHSYGYQHLSQRRRQFEEKAEAEVVNGFDLVLSPWPELVAKLRKRYPRRAKYIALLPHCYDRDDVFERSDFPAAHRPRLCYGGNLYHGFEETYAHLAQLAEEEKFVLDLWLRQPPKWILDLCNPQFRVMPQVSSNVFLAEARQADWLLLPIPETLKDGRPTKLLEFAATGVPILAFGVPGELSKEIERRGLGSFLGKNPDKEIIERSLSSRPDFKRDTVWIRSHEASNVTKNLLKLIQNIDHAYE